MLAKFMPILLFILDPIQFKYSVYGTSDDQDSVRFFESVCRQTPRGAVYEKVLTIKFNELEKYTTDIKQHENIKINEIKIYPLSWDLIKENSKIPNEMCGFGIKGAKTERVIVGDLYVFKGLKDNYEISYSTGYYEGHNFDDYTEAEIWCNIKQCDMGLFFFDKIKNAKTLNNPTSFFLRL